MSSEILLNMVRLINQLTPGIVVIFHERSSSHTFNFTNSYIDTGAVGLSIRTNPSAISRTIYRIKLNNVSFYRSCLELHKALGNYRVFINNTKN